MNKYYKKWEKMDDHKRGLITLGLGMLLVVLFCINPIGFIFVGLTLMGVFLIFIIFLMFYSIGRNWNEPPGP